MPLFWPTYPHFSVPYRYKGKSIDRQVIYTLTDTPEPPLSLQEAAAIGDIDLVKLRLSQGSAVDARESPTMTTAFIGAVGNSHKEVVALLLDQGADVNVRANQIGTPLLCALQNGDEEIIQLLLAAGADANMVDSDGYPSLYYAVLRNNIDVVKLLLEYGARFDSKMPNGMTVVQYAALRGLRDIVTLCLSQGVTSANIHLAAGAGNLVSIQRLIDQGVDVNVKDEIG